MLWVCEVKSRKERFECSYEAQEIDSKTNLLDGKMKNIWNETYIKPNMTKSKLDVLCWSYLKSELEMSLTQMINWKQNLLKIVWYK